MGDGRGGAVTDTLVRAPALSPLYRMAILKGAEASVLLHLRRGAALEARDDRGRTPLLLAASAGRLQTCRLLIAEGADLSAADADGRTAADLALAAGFAEIAAALRPSGTDARPQPEASPAGSDAWTTQELEGEPLSGWEAEDTPRTSASDVTLTTTVTIVQSAISGHRPVAVQDAWAEAEIVIPQAARPGRPRIERPEGAAGLFGQALRLGWTDDEQIARALHRSSPDVRRIASAALELSGVRVDAASGWTRAALADSPHARAPSADLEEALALLEDLLVEATDPAEIHAAELAGFATPDRDEEARLFRSLSDARAGLLGVVRRHREELTLWLEAALAGPAGGIDSESSEHGEEAAEPAAGGDLRVTDLEPLRFLLAEHGVGEDLSGEALPYAGFARLLEAAPAEGRAGEAGRSLARALDRFRHARDRVATASLRLVAWVARRYRRAPLPQMDLIQEGGIGLLRAIEKFDPERGHRFSTYATWWIRQAMSRAVADQSRIVRIPVHAVESLTKLERLDPAWTARTGAAPTIDEAASALERPATLIARLREAPSEPVAFEGDMDGGHAFPALDPQTPGHPEFGILDRDRRRGLARLLGQLGPREERVLRMRFGINIDTDMTLEDVGRQFDVTRERIRQIEAKALRRLISPTRLRELRQFS